MTGLETFLREHGITEVESTLPDMTGNARGKFYPTYKFLAEKSGRIPETILVQSVTGDWADNHYDLVDASDGEAVDKVREMTGGGVHYSFEAIGLKATAEEAFRMLRAGGTATVIGMIPPGQMVSLHGVDFLSEKKIQGSMMGSNRFRVDMPRFVDFYLQGKLHLDDMISNRIALADINEGMAALATGEIARSVIMFD